eukprot:Nk52_evm64s164 gene=Nk52_evmTU64s164
MCIRPFRNAGMVDLGWPTGFTMIAMVFLLKGGGEFKRRAILALLQCLSGVRFITGWLARTVAHGEDRKWKLRRSRWSKGKGLLGIRSHALNFFLLYQTQAIGCIAMSVIPYRYICNNHSPGLSFLEWASLVIWMVCFLLENIADLQLAEFKTEQANKGKTLMTGLWSYSRHPNYFFEFLVWCSYALYAVDSVSEASDYCFLLMVPAVAYYYFAFFSGIQIVEDRSRMRRGRHYIEYQKSTGMFFPWWPGKVKIA